MVSASPVRLHHVPNWFRLALLRAFGGRGSAGGEVVGRAVKGTWLDHWGSAEIIPGRTIRIVFSPSTQEAVKV